MKIGILNALTRDDAINGITEPALFKQFFQAVVAPFDLVDFNVTEGQLPTSPHTCDAFLITGSAQGVYDTPPWIPNLVRFIRACYQQRRKLVGICFGHQIIAHVLGGQVEKVEQGWGLGLREMEIQAEKSWMNPLLAHPQLYYAHQDQVIALPPEAELLGGFDFCPRAMYVIEDRVLGIQGHPEFTPTFMEMVIDALQDIVGVEIAQDARQSLQKGEADTAVIAQWIVNFLMFTTSFDLTP